MRIVDIMSENLVVPDLAQSTGEGVLETLVDKIQIARTEVDQKEALEVLLKRERVGSTGVGSSIAIPHAKLAQLKTAVACFGRSIQGIDFGAIDDKPVHLFLAVLVPEGQTALHLKVLARASRLFKDGQFRNRLLDAKSGPELWSLLQTQDSQLPSR